MYLRLLLNLNVLLLIVVLKLFYLKDILKGAFYSDNKTKVLIFYVWQNLGYVFLLIVFLCYRLYLKDIVFISNS